jgi:hypothetical protein
MIAAPEEWDRNLAAQCLAMITNIRCGDWRAPCVGRRRMHYGRPLAAPGKMQCCTAVRVFFADLQEWGVIPPRFDPYRSLTPPRSIKTLVSSGSPRIIADDVWAKLLLLDSMSQRRILRADETPTEESIPFTRSR